LPGIDVRRGRTGTSQEITFHKEMLDCRADTGNVCGRLFECTESGRKLQEHKRFVTTFPLFRAASRHCPKRPSPLFRIIENGFRFNLHQHVWINEAFDFYHARGWTDLPEYFSMSSAYFFPMIEIDNLDSRADYIIYAAPARTNAFPILLNVCTVWVYGFP
jgi:hypothetical protein